MKSSMISRNDPFMSGHQSIMAVDPNPDLNDIGYFTKDESQGFSTFPNWMELANMEDSQLVNYILDDDCFGITGLASTDTALTSSGNSCGTTVELTPNQSPNHDFEEFLNGLEFEFENDLTVDQFLNEKTAFTFDAFDANSNTSSNCTVDLTPPLTPVHQAATAQDSLSACLIKSGIANFEEVSSSLQQQMLQCGVSNGSASSESSQVSSPACTEVDTDNADTETFQAYSEDNGDAESVQSFSSTASSLKRKVKVEEDDDDEEYFPPSKKANKASQAPKRAAPRKTPARRNRRVQDERVKNQNKVAAMKYRAKKRDEKSTLDVLFEAEEEKNKKLKSKLEELQVNVDVLKELLGKYLKKE